MALGEFRLARALAGASGGDYGRRALGLEVVAALALGAAVLPQSLAVAQLAGVPAVAGLYTAAAAMLFYAALGASPRTIVVPDLPVAILAAAAVAAAGGGAVLTSLLGIMVGVICVVAGVARMGFMAHFLSGPIFAGYRSGVAVVIAVSQVPMVLGLKPAAIGVAGPLAQVAANLGQVRPSTPALALTALIILVVLGLLWPRAPAALIAVALTTLLVTWLNLDRAVGVAVIGQPPPQPWAPPVASAAEVATLVPAAFAVALIALTEAARTGRASGAGNGIDLDQDSVALGICNLAAGMVHGLPITASPAQTAVAVRAGARSRLTGIFCVVLLLATLVTLMPHLSQVPLAALSVVVIVAAVRLFDLSALRSLLDQSRLELALALLTLLAVLALGVLVGALVMAVLALLNMLRTVSRPHDRLLRTAGQEEPPDLVVYRFNAPLFFANARHLEERVRSAMAAAGSGVRWLVLDAEAIEDLDATAVEVLARVHDDLEAREVTLVIAGARTELLGALLRSELVDRIGVENLHETVGSAVASLRAAGRGQSGLGAYPDGRGQLE